MRRGPVDPDGDLRGLEAGFETGPRLGGRDGDRRVPLAVDPEGVDDSLDHSRRGLDLSPALLDQAAEYEPLAGAGYGDVEEPQSLGGVAFVFLFAKGLMIIDIDRGRAESPQLHADPVVLAPAEGQKRRPAAA